MSSINHDCDANDDDDNNDSINNNQILHSLSSNVCLFPFIFNALGTDCLNKHTLLSKRCLFLSKLLAC